MQLSAAGFLRGTRPAPIRLPNPLAPQGPLGARRAPRRPSSAPWRSSARPSRTSARPRGRGRRRPSSTGRRPRRLDLSAGAGSLGSLPCVNALGCFGAQHVGPCTTLLSNHFTTPPAAAARSYRVGELPDITPLRLSGLTGPLSLLAAADGALAAATLGAVAGAVAAAAADDPEGGPVGVSRSVCRDLGRYLGRSQAAWRHLHRSACAPCAPQASPHKIQPIDRRPYPFLTPGGHRASRRPPGARARGAQGGICRAPHLPGVHRRVAGRGPKQQRPVLTVCLQTSARLPRRPASS